MSGIDDLLRRINAVKNAARTTVSPVLEKNAVDLVGGIKALAPVDDGDLQKSVRSEKVSDLKILVKAGGELTTKPVRDGASATYDYALANEFGTAGMTAQPFFFTAFRIKKEKIKRSIKTSVGKAVRGAWSK